MDGGHRLGQPTRRDLEGINPPYACLLLMSSESQGTMCVKHKSIKEFSQTRIVEEKIANIPIEDRPRLRHPLEL